MEVARRKGTGPKFNEKMIQQCFDHPVSVEHIGPMQLGAMLSIVAGRDREVKRDFFIATADTALSLYSAMGRLHTLNLIKQMAENPSFKADPVSELGYMMQNVMAFAEKKKTELADMGKLITQCPTEDDPIS